MATSWDVIHSAEGGAQASRLLGGAQQMSDRLVDAARQQGAEVRLKYQEHGVDQRDDHIRMTIVGEVRAAPLAVLAMVPADAVARSARTDAERQQAICRQLARYFGEKARKSREYVEKDWCADKWTSGCYVGLMTPGTMSRCNWPYASPRRCRLPRFKGNYPAKSRNFAEVSSANGCWK